METSLISGLMYKKRRMVHGARRKVYIKNKKYNEQGSGHRAQGAGLKRFNFLIFLVPCALRLYIDL
jgi:hypothetical protein